MSLAKSQVYDKNRFAFIIHTSGYVASAFVGIALTIAGIKLMKKFIMAIPTKYAKLLKREIIVMLVSTWMQLLNFVFF